MLREARIHLPVHDNLWQSLDKVHRALSLALVGRFGGATVIDAQGLWADRGVVFDEAVKCYIVAVEDTAEVREALRQIARKAGRAAEQLAMYVRYPDGEVEIIDTTAEAVAA